MKSIRQKWIVTFIRIDLMYFLFLFQVFFMLAIMSAVKHIRG